MSIDWDEKLSLGKFLKAHRMGEEMSQVEFAKFLGVSKQRLCDMEHDRGNISIQLCKKIAKKLDLPEKWIVKLELQHQLDKAGVKLRVS
ncbi:MAG: helix-turn-helix transcriptional regulator [Bdellovibrionales bacterium]|nr:helix-turn-helix transcriptional regulator [Bdellovibrionales bacterium]